MPKQRNADQSKTRRVRSATVTEVGRGTSPHMNHDKLKVEFTEDAWHCYETPYCQLLCELAQDIVPIKELQGKELNLTKSTLLDNGLTALIRSHLVNYRRLAVPWQDSGRKTTKESNDGNMATTSNDPPADCDVLRSCSVLHKNIMYQNKSRSDYLHSLTKFVDEKLTPLVITDSTASGRRNFMTFLNDLLLMQYQATHHKINTKKSHLLSQGSCHIHFSQVQAAVEAIACPSCRGAVRKIFMSEFCLQVDTPDSSTVSSVADDIAIDEEVTIDLLDATLSQQQLVFQTVNHKGIDYVKGSKLEPNAGWHLRRQSRKNPQTSNSSWLPEDIEFMVMHYILTAGLHPDVVTGAIRLQDDNIASICGGVEKQVSGFAQRFRDLAKLLERQVEEFVQLQVPEYSQIDGFGIDTRIAQVVAETDSVCCQVIKQVLRVVLDVSRMLRYILAHHATAAESSDETLDEFGWAILHVNEIVKTFWDGVASCYECGFAYEQQLVALGDRLGNAPAIYLSTSNQTLFVTAVEGKIRAVHQMLLSIERTLNQHIDVEGYGRNNLSTTFVRKLATTELFYAEVRKQDREQQKLLLSKSEQNLDDIIAHIFTLVASAWPISVPVGNIGQIYTMRHARHDDLLAGLSNLLDHCETNEVCGNYVKMKAVVSSLKFEISKITESLAEEDLFFPHHVTRLFSSWIELKTIPQSKRVRMSEKMPLKLKHAMAVFNNSSPTSLPLQLSCDGMDGRQRAVGLLVGLFFRGWLLDRFKEWHARIIEEELLGSLAVGDSRLALVDFGKMNVCTKKKKKKASLMQKKFHDDAVRREMVFDLNVVKESDPPGSTENSEPLTILPKRVDSAVQFGHDEASCNAASNDGSCPGGCAATEYTASLVIAPIPACDVDETIDDGLCRHLDAKVYCFNINPTRMESYTYEDVESQVKVFVHGICGIQSAEDYLLRRLLSASNLHDQHSS